MARQKGWFTVASESGAVSVASVVGDVVVATGLLDPTILRTRAYVGLASAREALPPFYPGNANSPKVFRMVASTPADPPVFGWQFEADSVDDLTFHPLIWNDGLYVPASTDMTRPEGVLANAYLAGGVVDVKGERHFSGDTNVVLSYYFGPALGTATDADPLFTAQWWFRCLIEATI